METEVPKKNKKKKKKKISNVSQVSKQTLFMCYSTDRGGYRFSTTFTSEGGSWMFTQKLAGMQSVKRVM